MIYKYVYIYTYIYIKYIYYNHLLQITFSCYLFVLDTIVTFFNDGIGVN